MSRMRKKMQQVGTLLLMAVVLLMTVSMKTLAQEVPDLDRKGSITLSLAYKGKAVTGGKISIWLVGDIKEDDGNYGFEKTKAFSGYAGNLDDISSSGLADKLASYIEKNKISASGVQSNTSGKVTFSDLKPGLYLVSQTTASDGYKTISPFLVSVPQYTDNAYVYDVNATPKLGTLTPTTPTTPPKTPGSKLPQTGQLNWPIPILACSGLLFFVIGWMINNTGRNENEK